MWPARARVPARRPGVAGRVVEVDSGGELRDVDRIVVSLEVGGHARQRCASGSRPSDSEVCTGSARGNAKRGFLAHTTSRLQAVSAWAKVSRWAVQDSNLRPPACKAGALPAELTARAATDGSSGRSLSSARPPPSTSGPGRHPFKVVARVRFPLGALRRVAMRKLHCTVGQVCGGCRKIASGATTGAVLGSRQPRQRESRRTARSLRRSNIAGELRAGLGRAREAWARGVKDADVLGGELGTVSESERQRTAGRRLRHTARRFLQGHTCEQQPSLCRASGRSTRRSRIEHCRWSR